jgi:hypothetical protein
MSGAHDAAVDAMTALLAELPAEFSHEPTETSRLRREFKVVKRRNVRRVHNALWELQQHLGMVE